MFGHFGPNTGIFCPFRPMPDQKPMRARCLGGFSCIWVTKLLISPVKIRIFCPRTTKFGIFVYFGPGLSASFGALLVGWLVVLERGLYLARHLFTLSSLLLIAFLSLLMVSAGYNIMRYSQPCLLRHLSAYIVLYIYRTRVRSLFTLVTN